MVKILGEYKMIQQTIVKCAGSPDCGIDKCYHINEHPIEPSTCASYCFQGKHCRLIETKEKKETIR